MWYVYISIYTQYVYTNIQFINELTYLTPINTRVHKWKGQVILIFEVLEKGKVRDGSCVFINL